MASGSSFALPSHSRRRTNVSEGGEREREGERSGAEVERGVGLRLRVRVGRGHAEGEGEEGSESYFELICFLHRYSSACELEGGNGVCVCVGGGG